MKDYNEMAKSVFEKRDEYLLAKKRRRGMILKAGVPLCSLVLVTLVSLLVWQAKLPEIPVKHTEDAGKTDSTQNSGTSPNTVMPTDKEVIGTAHSVTAQQSAVYSAEKGENVIKPTQNYQENTGNKPQSQPSKPQSEQEIPQPNTSGDLTYPMSPDVTGGACIPEVPGNDSVSGGDLWAEPNSSAGPQERPPFPNDFIPDSPSTTEGILGGNEAEVPTTSIETTVPTEPEPTGPVEITVADKTYAAQVGDKVTYMVELQAQERFEDFFVHLKYDGDRLDLMPPEYVNEDDIPSEQITLPNIPNGIVNYNYNNESHVVAIGSWLGKYNFKTRRFFLKLEFIVKSEGEVNLDFWVEDMQITKDRFYFYRNEPKVTEGIKFYEYIIVN